VTGIKRSQAEQVSAALPPLLAQAHHLAGSVIIGEHGRKRAGQGDDFWQYRQAEAGDTHRQIDWRKSARNDVEYIREQEWKIAQSILIWVDGSASMQFSSQKDLSQKHDRAQLLALALSILLLRGGERVGLWGSDTPPRQGQSQVERLAQFMTETQPTEYGQPSALHSRFGGRSVFLSDFLGEWDQIENTLSVAADQSKEAVIMQLMDPAEHQFPYRGRRIFQSINGTVEHETLKANDLRQRYLDRMAERQDKLATFARRFGWHYQTHVTENPARPALIWLYQALERSQL